MALRATCITSQDGNATPTVERCTSVIGVLSASSTMAWRLRRTSRSVKSGRFSSSSTSNQSIHSAVKHFFFFQNVYKRLTKLSSAEHHDVTCFLIDDHLTSSLFGQSVLSESGNSGPDLASVGILAVPNSRVYWSMSRGRLRNVSGSNNPCRRSCMKPRDEITREAARGS